MFVPRTGCSPKIPSTHTLKENWICCVKKATVQPEFEFLEGGKQSSKEAIWRVRQVISINCLSSQNSATCCVPEHVFSIFHTRKTERQACLQAKTELANNVVILH